VTSNARAVRGCAVVFLEHRGSLFCNGGHA
jgi:hypothetical protein